MTTMTLNTRLTHATILGTPVEALYPREGFYTDESGKIKPIFLGHREATCGECEFPLGSETRHPRDEARPGLVILCGGHRMRFVE